MVIFVFGNIIILLVVFFEDQVLKLFCKLNYGEMEAISDDYYDEIHAHFLVNEYERAKLEQRETKHFMDSIKDRADFQEVKPRLEAYVKTLHAKETTISEKIRKLCGLINLKEAPIEENIRQLMLQEEKLA